MKKFFVWLATVCVCLVALAFIWSVTGPAQQFVTCPTTNSNPNFTAGGNVFSRLASQWNAYFSAKVDANNGVLCNATFGPGTVFQTPNILGNANFGGSGLPTNLSGPTNPGDAANKQYVDTHAIGLVPQQGVTWATAGQPLVNSPTYSNGSAGVGATLTSTTPGALTVDGGVPALNDRILVKDQVNQTQNGVYYQTQVGTGAVPYILTRVLDWDTAAQMLPNSYFFVSSGTTNPNTSWFLVAPTPPVVVGTSILMFNQFSASQVLTGDNSTVHIGGNVIGLVPSGVTNTYLSPMNPGTIKANLTGIIQNPSDSTLAQVTAALGACTPTLQGVVIPNGNSGQVLNGLCSFVNLPIAANPSGIAGPTANNGVSANYMRADATPSVQTGSNSQLGLLECDTTTTNCVGGKITVVGGGGGGTGLNLVSTNAALKALTVPPTTTFIIRLGYNSAGDGGYAEYNFSGTACTLSSGNGDNGYQVKPNSGTGCWIADFTGQQISPMIWGCAGNGSTDDTVCINAAIAYSQGIGQVLYTGPHRYGFSSGFTIASPIDIEGCIQGVWKGVFSNPLITQPCGFVALSPNLTAFTVNAAGVKLQGFQLDMGPSNTSGTAIISTANSSLIRGLQISRSYNGIDVKSGLGFYLENNQITDVVNNCIIIGDATTLAGTQNGRITGNICAGTHLYPGNSIGMWIQDAKGVYIENNYISWFDRGTSVQTVTANQNIIGLQFVNTVLGDTDSTVDFYMDSPVTSGVIHNIQITSSRALNTGASGGTPQGSVIVTNTGTGSIDGIHFDILAVYPAPIANAPDAIHIGAVGPLTDITIRNSSLCFTSNTTNNGLFIGPAVLNLEIIGNIIGSCDQGTTATVANGVVLNNPYPNNILSNNLFPGVTNPISGAGVTSSIPGFVSAALFCPQGQPDGASDNSVCLQNVVNAMCPIGGTLLLTKGNWTFHDINISCPVIVQGAGKTSTVVNYINSANYGIQWQVAGFPGFKSNAHVIGGGIEELTLKDTSTSDTSNALNIKGFQNWHAKHLVINTPYIGMYSIGNENLDIQDISIQGSRKQDFFIYGDLSGFTATGAACSLSNTDCSTRSDDIVFHNTSGTGISSDTGMEIEGFVYTITGEHLVFNSYNIPLFIHCQTGLDPNMSQCPHFIYFDDYEGTSFHNFGLEASDFFDIKINKPYFYGDGSATNQQDAFLASVNYTPSTLPIGQVKLTNGRFFTTQKECILTGGTLTDLKFIGNDFSNCNLANSGFSGIHLGGNVTQTQVSNDTFCTVSGFAGTNPLQYGVLIDSGVSKVQLDTNSYFGCGSNLLNNSSLPGTIYETNPNPPPPFGALSGASTGSTLSLVQGNEYGGTLSILASSGVGFVGNFSFNLTQAIYPSPVCSFLPRAGGTGNWNPGATITYLPAVGNVTVYWQNNGGVLNSGSTYFLDYRCGGF